MCECPEVANVDRIGSSHATAARLDETGIPSMDELALRKSEPRFPRPECRTGHNQARQAVRPTRDVVNPPGPGRVGKRSEPAPGHFGFAEHTGLCRGRRATVDGDIVHRLWLNGSNNATRGCQAGRHWRLRRRSKPLKGKAQGRYRCETEPERLRKEQDARRLRKPVGVAQPGEANPVWVAFRSFIRRRATKPYEGMLACLRVNGSRWVIL